MKTKTKKILLITTTIVLSLLTICGLVVSMLYCNGSLDTLQVANAIEPPVQQGLRFNQIGTRLNIASDYSPLVPNLSNDNFSINVKGVNNTGKILWKSFNDPSNFYIQLSLNHKYYLAFNVHGSYTNTEFYFKIYKKGTSSYQNVVALAAIYDCLEYDNIQYLFRFNNNANVDITVSPIVVDLTYMFGEGKEPKTVEDVQKYLVPGTYYPYTPIRDFDKELEDARKDGYENGLSQGLSDSQNLFKYYQYGPHIIKQNNNLTIGALETTISPTPDGHETIIYHDFNFDYYSEDHFCYSDQLVGYQLNGTGREMYQPKNKPIDITNDNVIDLFNDFKWIDCSTPYKLANALKNKPTGSYLCWVNYAKQVSNYVGVHILDFNNATSSAIDNFLTINNSGYQDGKKDGINIGYNDGYAVGHSDGVKQGIEDANNYNFFTLISAVIDAPINAITNAFDFEFLGINIKQFLFSILTIGIVLFGLRLAVGGK